IANRALEDLRRRYTVAEEKSGLVLTKKTGNMKLFLYELDDLHQWDFIHNQKMVKEIERLQDFARKIDEHRENWKRRALASEAKLAETDRQLAEALANAERRALASEAKLAETDRRLAEALANANRQNVSKFRYAALRRYLAKRFHPDYAPGHGIEKVVRNEIFKEIWSEIESLDYQPVPATARPSSAI